VAEEAAPRGPAWSRRIARWRVPIGFVCGVVALWLAQPTRATILGGGAIAAVGEAVRIWAAGHLNKSREVTASGPYRWVAHPLYIGSSIMGAGLAVGAGSLPVAVMIAVYLLVTLTAAVRSEEAFLRSAFGDRYDRYRQAGEVNAGQSFSVERAFANREYRAVVGLAVALLLLALKTAYN
jgi:protein-S-isoprenylcysteine O-methyltransferase Ste14